MAKRKVVPAVIIAALIMLGMSRCAVEEKQKQDFEDYKNGLNFNNQTSQHQVIDQDYSNGSNNNYVIPEQNQEVTYFEIAKQNIANYASTDNLTKLKQTGKDCVVTAVDFIFYDKPINGVYFSNLTNDAKRAILIQISNIDAAIMEYYPEYKTELAQKYKDASAYLNAKYLGTLDTIKQRLASITYEDIENTTNEITNEIGEGYKKGHSFIKDKYNEWNN